MSCIRHCHVSAGWVWVLAVAVVSVVWAPAADAARVENFSFVQVSDLHMSPWPAGTPSPFAGDRSTAGLAWIAEQLGTPQELKPLNLTAPKPAFVLATGDITEFGAIADTWKNVEKSFNVLNLPVYYTPGNHDNTWTSMLSIMHKLHGGDHYAFEQFGCRFIGIETATPQEPVPSIDQRTITWLANDLAKVPKDMPVFIFCHHPLSSGEFAQPHEPVRLLETIREHNVVLHMMGHGHGVSSEKWGTLDSVMGGSTFGPNTGYSIISVIDGTLRVVYRFKNEERPMQVVLEKPIAKRATPGLEVVRPRDGMTIVGRGVSIEARATGGRPAALSVSLDNDKEKTVALRAGSASAYRGEVPTAGLVPGMHFVRLTGECDQMKLDRVASFSYLPADAPVRPVRTVLSAGFKAQPIVVDRGCLVASTDGQITRLVAGTADNLQAKTLIDVGAAILHAPALADGILYFGSADRYVYAVALDGSTMWKRQVNGSAFGTPALDPKCLYVGDLEGYVHALDRQTGEPKWSVRHATFSIEQPLLLHDGVLYVGAWDAQVYAINATDGSLRWKAGAPSGFSDAKKRNRYYGAADCAGLVVGDRLFFCDRGYQLGSYSLDGKYLGDIAAGVAAIGLTEDGQGFYARGLSKGLTRYDAQGNAVWSQPVSLGRFPLAPVEVNGKVFVCSNHGRVTAHDAADGRLLWEYAATPDLPVMAQVAVTAEGSAIVAGMDGSVTWLSPR